MYDIMKVAAALFMDGMHVTTIIRLLSTLSFMITLKRHIGNKTKTATQAPIDSLVEACKITGAKAILRRWSAKHK